VSASTPDGRALLADDMHLGFACRTCWYAVIVWPTPKRKTRRRQREHRVRRQVPGLRVIVAAMPRGLGIHQQRSDWVDVVIVEVDPNDNDPIKRRWPAQIRHRQEIIRSKASGRDARRRVDPLGPMWITISTSGSAIRWVAHDAEGANWADAWSRPHFGRSVRLANLSGSPRKLFVVPTTRAHCLDDSRPHSALRRFDGRCQARWAAARAVGTVSDAENIQDRGSRGGRLWTANARVVSGECWPS